MLVVLITQAAPKEMSVLCFYRTPPPPLPVISLESGDADFEGAGLRCVRMLLCGLLLKKLLTFGWEFVHCVPCRGGEWGQRKGVDD